MMLHKIWHSLCDILSLTQSDQTSVISNRHHNNERLVLQVFAQPVFENIESSMTEQQLWPSKQPRLMRAVVRSLYVVVTAFVAICLPFFADLMGLIGAAGFTPMTFILPCVFWLKVRTHMHTAMYILAEGMHKNEYRQDAFRHAESAMIQMVFGIEGRLPLLVYVDTDAQTCYHGHCDKACMTQ